MSADVVCMSLANVPPGEQRSRFLAVGLVDNTVRIISLDPSVSSCAVFALSLVWNVQKNPPEVDCVHPNCLSILRWVSRNGKLSFPLLTGRKRGPWSFPVTVPWFYWESLMPPVVQLMSHKIIFFYCFGWVFCWVSPSDLPVCTCTKSRRILQANWQQTKLTICLPATDEVFKAGCSNLNFAQVAPCWIAANGARTVWKNPVYFL